MNNAEMALDLLREHGWCRGEWQNDKGELCLAGASALAAGQVPAPGWWSPARSVVVDVMREQYGVFGFISFNDDPARDFADVERVLEKASVRLDEAVA